MTTKRSPLSKLKAQANNIAKMLKAFERVEKIDFRFADKLEAARGNDVIKFAVVMDDKIIKIDMPWATIRETSEVGIAAWILDQMREARQTAN